MPDASITAAGHEGLIQENPPMAFTERREHLRHEINAAATVSGQKGVLPCRLTNISADGVGFVAVSAVLPGSQVVIRLHHKDRILLKGVVIWARLVVRKSRVVYEMGAKISAMAFKQIIAETNSDRCELVKHILKLLADG